MSMASGTHFQITADASDLIQKQMMAEAGFKQMVKAGRDAAREAAKAGETWSQRLQDAAKDAARAGIELEKANNNLKAFKQTAREIPPLKLDPAMLAKANSEITSATMTLGILEAQLSRAQNEYRQLTMTVAAGGKVSMAAMTKAAETVSVLTSEAAKARAALNNLTGAAAGFAGATGRASMMGMQFAFMVDDVREAFAQGGGLPQVIRATGNNISMMLSMLGGPWMWAGIAGMTALQIAFSGTAKESKKAAENMDKFREATEKALKAKTALAQGEKAATEEAERRKEDKEILEAETAFKGRETQLRRIDNMIRRGEAQGGAVGKGTAAAGRKLKEQLESGLNEKGEEVATFAELKKRVEDLKAGRDARRDKVMKDAAIKERERGSQKAIQQFGGEGLTRLARDAIARGEDPRKVEASIAGRIAGFMGPDQKFAIDVANDAVRNAQEGLRQTRFKASVSPETPAEAMKRGLEEKKSILTERQQELEAPLGGRKPTGLLRKEIDEIKKALGELAPALTRATREVNQAKREGGQRELNVPGNRLVPLPPPNYQPGGDG